MRITSIEDHGTVVSVFLRNGPHDRYTIVHFDRRAFDHMHESEGGLAPMLARDDWQYDEQKGVMSHE